MWLRTGCEQAATHESSKVTSCRDPSADQSTAICSNADMQTRQEGGVQQ